MNYETTPNRHQQESAEKPGINTPPASAENPVADIENAYAESFLGSVPPIWTEAKKIQAPFIVLETLEHIGLIEMKIIQLYRSSGMVAGCRHLFRRVL